MVTGSTVTLPDAGTLLRRARARRPVVLDGANSVRPYVIADEQRQQEQRRRALLLATFGVDVGPRVIHGVMVR
jgi:hypothetical protein